MVFMKKFNTISSQRISRLLWNLLHGNNIYDTSFWDAIVIGQSDSYDELV